ncbi:MAG: flippase-like domain-containing protein [Oligoflexia bacterium]|nr:flippase-like domain-containing protein [Oligoflexia bacterium]
MSLSSNPVIRITLRLAPWLITLVALYGAFRGVDWNTLLQHMGSAQPTWLCLAVALTCLSYLMRSRRWQSLFPKPTLDFIQAARVLVLGFFMNNVLPARAGELVRAHMGSRTSGESRTLVLATIASERLVDGLTLSVFFVVFSFHLGDARLSENLSYVALLFAGATAAVIATLLMRRQLLNTVGKLNARINHNASHYVFGKLQVFLEGLSPLCSLRQFLPVALWSLVIWSIELFVYVTVTWAFGAHLSLSECVLFMVAVNFSSLIPSAPGAIGVIEAIATSVLVSVGIPKELALTMVIAQHIIQYLVVGIPGAIIMLTWKASIRAIQDDTTEALTSRC